MRTRTGFTLIELLVVIAVIALLMGILMPALGKAREQGRKTVCTAHMRGLGVSLRMYVDDNGDMFHIAKGDTINLTQWRNGGTMGNFPDAVQECFRHEGTSNTCWLDGHVSGIKETTGEDVPASWYTGVQGTL